MAVKSIIEIELQDAAFQKFRDQFKEYELQVKRVQDATKTIGAGFGAVSAHVSNAWHGLARDTKGVAAHIESATRSLLRWGAITGAMSGLLGAGGLFGIDRLAQSAGNQRRSAFGLGATPGEQRAFSVNFGRVVDPASFLSGVNQAMHDVTKRVGLYGAGLTEGDIRGKDTAQVGAELIPALKKLADQTPTSMMEQVLKARHLDQFISLQDFERLKNTPAGELGSYGAQFRRDSQTMNLSRQQQKAWQDLQVTLQRAGTEIEQVFIRQLTVLAPQIGHLSDSVVGLIKAMLSSPDVKVWIDDTANALKTFAHFIGTPEFKADVEGFASGVAKMVTAIGSFLGLFGGGSAGSAAKPIVPHGQEAPTTSGWGYNPSTGRWEYQKGTADKPAAFHPGAGGFSGIEHRDKLPPGILDAVWKQESRRGKYMISKAGALGHFQFMPATAEKYGLTNPFDLDQSSEAAGRYLHDLLRQFGGNTEEALAAYNWGPGNVKRDLAKYGAAWRSHLPRETADYVDTITRRIRQPSPHYAQEFKDRSVRVQIHNNTGGNVNVTASQLGIS